MKPKSFTMHGMGLTGSSDNDVTRSLIAFEQDMWYREFGADMEYNELIRQRERQDFPYKIEAVLTYLVVESLARSDPSARLLYGFLGYEYTKLFRRTYTSLLIEEIASGIKTVIKGIEDWQRRRPIEKEIVSYEAPLREAICSSDMNATEYVLSPAFEDFLDSLGDQQTQEHYLNKVYIQLLGPNHFFQVKKGVFTDIKRTESKETLQEVVAKIVPIMGNAADLEFERSYLVKNYSLQNLIE